jgi:hypothetical protein
MELTKLNHALPLKAYPEKDLNTLLATQFKFWLCGLLSMKSSNEDAVDASLPAIKKHCWSLGLREVKKMFEMYVDGELSITPRSNYLDRVLVGQIFQSYKAQQRTKPIKKDIDQEKRDQDLMDVISLFDNFIQFRKIDDRFVWVYTYLDEKGLMNYYDEKKRFNQEKIVLFTLGKEQKLTDEEAKIKAKIVLLRRYFERLEAKDQHIKDKL